MSNLTERLTDLEQIGRIMHESWCKTKREQGFHGPEEKCPENPTGKLIRYRTNPTANNCVCRKQHSDLIPWADLPEKQKDINRHAFDAILPYFIPKQEAAEQVAAVVGETIKWIEDWDRLNGGKVHVAAVAIIYGLKQLHPNPTEILARRDKDNFTDGRNFELKVWKQHLRNHYRDGTKMYGTCSFCKGEKENDDKIHQAALEEAAKAAKEHGDRNSGHGRTACYAIAQAIRALMEKER